MDLLRRIMLLLVQPLSDCFDLAFQSVSGAVTTGNGTRRPRFSPSVWNIHDITVNNADRTNNFTEAWNRGFETLLSENHPSVGTCNELLQEAYAAQAASILLKHANGIIERREDDADGSRCNDGCTVSAWSTAMNDDRLNINFFLLPTKFLQPLSLAISVQPPHPLLICCHSFSPTYHLIENHRSLIQICIIPSLESTP